MQHLLWKAAAVGFNKLGYELRDRITRDFNRLWTAAGKPVDWALLQLVDSAGDLSSLYLTPSAVTRCKSLFEAYKPWLDCLPPSRSIPRLSWVAGDKNVLQRLYGE